MAYIKYDITYNERKDKVSTRGWGERKKGLGGEKDALMEKVCPKDLTNSRKGKALKVRDPIGDLRFSSLLVPSNDAHSLPINAIGK